MNWASLFCFVLLLLSLLRLPFSLVATFFFYGASALPGTSPLSWRIAHRLSLNRYTFCNYLLGSWSSILQCRIRISSTILLLQGLVLDWRCDTSFLPLFDVHSNYAAKIDAASLSQGYPILERQKAAPKVVGDTSYTKSTKHPNRIDVSLKHPRGTSNFLDRHTCFKKHCLKIPWRILKHPFRNRRMNRDRKLILVTKAAHDNWKWSKSVCAKGARASARKSWSYRLPKEPGRTQTRITILSPRKKRASKQADRKKSIKNRSWKEMIKVRRKKAQKQERKTGRKREREKERKRERKKASHPWVFKESKKNVVLAAMQNWKKERRIGIISVP